MDSSYITPNKTGNREMVSVQFHNLGVAMLNGFSMAMRNHTDDAFDLKDVIEQTHLAVCHFVCKLSIINNEDDKERQLHEFKTMLMVLSDFLEGAALQYEQQHESFKEFIDEAEEEDED